MKLCIAGTASRGYMLNEFLKGRYYLESFYAFADWQKELIKKSDLFLLDSGAFTFMNNTTGTDIDWYKYLDSYAKCIKSNNIKYFFELDIDVVVGYEEVKRMRKYLENKVGRKCIPVWHKSRGLDEWIKMCQEYDYVAIGGFVVNEIKKEEYKFVHYLLNIARKNKTKVHGLGFTGNGVDQYDFYSVDSTSWLGGGRHGTVFLYRNGKINSHTNKDKRTIYYRELDKHNLAEWIKYQNYLDRGYI